MPLVNAKCTNCNAELLVDNTKDALVCQFCGSAFIVEKAITNYNITNHNHINAGVVNIYGSNSNDFLVRGGVLEKYDGSDIDVIIPNNVKHVKSSAFEGYYAIRSITVPDGVVSFDMYHSPELSKIDLPNSLKSLVILDCPKLTKLDLPNGLEILNIDLSGITEIDFPDSIRELNCRGCNNLTSVNIPKGVTIIGDDTFENLKNLKNVNIPSSVKVIGKRSFMGCENLEYVWLHEGLERIECGHDSDYGDNNDGAFKNCRNLKEISIPNSVKHIGTYAFSGCKKLLNVQMSEKQLRHALYYDEYPNTDTRTYFDKKSYVDGFRFTPFEWKHRGKCIHCGGNFKGFFEKKCSSCGKTKDY